MRRVAWRRAAALVLALAPAAAVHAQDDPGTAQPAAGVEIWSSTDSDKTYVVKALGRALWRFDGSDKYQGIAFEHAWFSPEGQRVRRQDRIYLDFADAFDGKWKWHARVGTNGHTMLGSASIRSSDWSKEFFVEREVVETPRGVDEGIYYTFEGASADLLAGERDTLNAVAAVQEFTGRNVRLHLRGTYVHVVEPKIGLSLQLRARYFHSTVPNEFDYYSPREFLQLLPVVQLRRFSRTGWMYLVAAGYGAQKATGSAWQSARLAEIRIESPASSRKLQAFGQFQYSNNSLTGGARNYRYFVMRGGVTARLK
jgi:hypothetical protein